MLRGLSAVPAQALVYPPSQARVYPPSQATAGIAAPQFGYSDKHLSNTEVTDHFYAPDPSRAAVRMAKSLIRNFFRTVNAKLVMSREDAEKLNKLVNSPDGTVIAMNHSADLDVMTVMEIARQARFTPVVMGTVELFQSQMLGMPVGKLLPKIGGMSVDRAAKNKDATLEGAKKVVHENKYPLFLCPEGFVTHANRTVFPLKNGASHVALGNALEYGQNVNVVPVSVYYHYSKDLTNDIRGRVEELENRIQDQLGFRFRPVGTLKGRAENLFKLLVRERQIAYNVPDDIEHIGESPYDSLNRVRESILDSLECKYLNREFDGKGGQEIRARRLMGHLRREMAELHKQEPKGFKKLARAWNREESETKPKLDAMQADMQKLDDVINLSMYQEGYPLDNNDALISMLIKLRRDITRDEKWIKENPMFLPQYPVQVIVKVGDPIPAAGFAAMVKNEGLPVRIAETRYSESIRKTMQAGIDETVATLPH